MLNNTANLTKTLIQQTRRLIWALFTLKVKTECSTQSMKDLIGKIPLPPPPYLTYPSPQPTYPTHIKPIPPLKQLSLLQPTFPPSTNMTYPCLTYPNYH